QVPKAVMATTYPRSTATADSGRRISGPGVQDVAGPPTSGPGHELPGHDLQRGVQAADLAVAGLVGRGIVRRRHLRPHLPEQLVDLDAEQGELGRSEALERGQAHQD